MPGSSTKYNGAFPMCVSRHHCREAAPRHLLPLVRLEWRSTSSCQQAQTCWCVCLTSATPASHGRSCPGTTRSKESVAVASFKLTLRGVRCTCGRRLGPVASAFVTQAPFLVVCVRIPSGRTQCMCLRLHTDARSRSRVPAGGRAVVTGGEGTQCVSVFDLQKADSTAASSALQDGMMLSQTEVTHRVSTLRCSGSLVACAGASTAMSILRASL